MEPPRRPRSHSLEAESLRAFGDALPDCVVREQHPDYSIDVQVQFFDDGIATPIFFFAQLKSTDSACVVDDVLRFRFETRHLFYWVKQDIPVMLAVYDASQRGFHYDWVSRVFALTSEEDIREWRFQKTATISLRHRLAPAFGSRVRAEVEHGLRGLGVQSSFSRIFVMRITGDETAVVDRVYEDINRWLHHCGITRVRARTDRDGDATIHISVQYGTIRLEYLNEYITFPLDVPLKNTRVTALTRTLTCMLLTRAGHAKYSVTLLNHLLSSEPSFKQAAINYLSSPDGATVFAKADRRIEGLEIALELAESGQADTALTLIMGCRTAERSELVEQRVRHVLKKLIEHGKSDRYLGSLHYNVANSLGASGQHRAAVHEFLKAVTLSPDYAARPYWWREYGGSLYLSGRVRLAELAYRRAQELEPSNKLILALLGDTLFVRGRFREAAELYAEHLHDNARPSAEFILKAWLARNLFEKFGDVRRQPSLALERAKAACRENDEQSKYHELANALDLDPLCVYAWWELAVGTKQRETVPFEIWAVIATLATWDLTAMGTAVAAAKTAKNADAENSKNGNNESREIEAGALAFALIFEATQNYGEESVVNALTKQMVKDVPGARSYAELLIESAKTMFIRPPDSPNIRVIEP